MAISVSEDLTLISNCDATSGWTGGTRFEADTGVKIQGTACLADWINNTTMPVASYAITQADLSNGEHLYCWMYCSGVVDTQANGGFRLYAEDADGDSATWYVGGSDTHGTGWQLMCCDFSATPDSESGTFDPTTVTDIGVSFKTVTAAIKKGQTYIMNCFWDVLRYGTGLTITSGATDDITMEDIFAVDNTSTNKFGVVQKNYGAYIITGTLTFGDTGTGSIDAVIDGEVLLYPSNDYISSTFNTIQVLGNSTGTSNFDLTGSFVKSNNISGTLDLDGTNLDTINVTGTSLVNMGVCSFAASQTITGNVFDGCAQVQPSTSTFTDNSIKNSTNTTTGALFLPGTSGVDRITFSGNTYDAYITDATTFSNVSFTHNGTNTSDLYYTNAGNATFNVPADGDTATVTNSSTGTLTIVAGQVTLTLSGLVTNSEVRVYTHGTTTELDGVENSGTSFDYTYTYVASTYVDIVIHNVDYQYIRLENILLGSTSASVPIQQIYDRNYDNP